MRAQPFSFLEQVDDAPPAGALPQEANILFRYEDPNTNVSGTTWNDTSALGVTSLSFTSDSGVDATSNSLQLMLSTNNTNQWIRINTTQNINIKSLLIIKNTWKNLTTVGTTRDYFYDHRKAASVSSGGYFNQYDSVAGGNTIHGNDGEYYVYDDSDGNIIGPQATTAANLTNGFSNSSGGNGLAQFLGPNGKSAYLPRRLWHFHYNTSTNGVSGRSLLLETTATRGLVFGANDNLGETTPFGYFAIVGWSERLSSAEVSQAVDYFKTQGVLS